MKILNPVGDVRYIERRDKLAPRLSDLAGKVIGFVDDGAGKSYFQRIEELLTERAKVAQIIRKVKPLLSAPSPRELVDEVASACDAVIVGVGI